MSDMVPEVLNAALDSLFTPKEPGEQEYQGENGLLYCRNCHTPVQCRVKLWGRDKIVPCLCRCQQEAMAEKKRQGELVEWQCKIRQLKATGIQEKHLLEWNFAVAEDNKDIQMAKRYVEQWKKVKTENLGLLLWGDVGTGKSFVAACIANALLEQGIPVLMTNFSKILNQILSSGTAEGIDVAMFLAVMATKESSFYYCDEYFSNIQSDIEKRIFGIMLDRIGDDEQLIFTTHNTDMLDLNLPKHSYVFLRKHLKEGVYQVSAVSASDVLKRNTDSLRCAVENDVFASHPQDSLLDELEMWY